MVKWPSDIRSRSSCITSMPRLLNLLNLVVLIVLFVLAHQVGRLSADNWEYKLVHDLLDGYDSSIRPSVHHNVTLNVTFGLALAQLIDVDERNMIITSNCWLNQGWIDSKLKWDPKEYDGIEFIHIPADKIWRPDILLVNNADSWAKISSMSTNAMVRYNGNVTWLSTVIFKSSCSINVRYFPFDEQQCDMIFASWTFDSFFLDINFNSKEGDLTNYIKNGEWHLVMLSATKQYKVYSCCEDPYPEIWYKMVIRRRPLYYVFNMVFPCLLITLVAFLGFYLPPDSTDKVSIGITTLLSITVFLMLVAESMPPTSEQLPLLGIYYAVTIGIVSFSTAMAVITLNVNHKGDNGRKCPGWIKFIFLDVMAKILRTDVSLYRKKRKLIRRASRIARSRSFMINNTSSSSQNNSSMENELLNMRSNMARANYDESVGFDRRSLLGYKSSPKLYKNSRQPTTSADYDNIHMPGGSGAGRLLTQQDVLRYNIFKEESMILEATDSLFRVNKPSSSSSVASANVIDNNKLLIKAHRGEFANKTGPASKQFMAVGAATASPGNKYFNTRAPPADYELNDDYYPNAVNNKNRFQSPYYFTPPQKRQSAGSSSNYNEPSKANTSGVVAGLNNSEFLLEFERIFERNFGPVLTRLASTLDQKETNKWEQEDLDEIKNEWAQVALVADHFLCYFFPLLTIFLCLTIFFYSPHTLKTW